MEKQLNILLVTIDGGGNIPPMLGLAKRLSSRGHQVNVLSEPCLEQAVKSYGLNFISFNKYFTRTDRTEDILRDWNASLFSDPVLDNVVFGPVETVVAETRKALSKTNADILIADCLLPPSLIAAESLQIPNVVVFHFPEYFPGPNRPPGFMGLLPGKGVFGKLRDKFLGKIFEQMLKKYLPKINEVRASYSLHKMDNITEMFHNSDLRFIQTLKSFDFPIKPAPVNVRYTGPILDDPDWTDSWNNPWKSDDPRPLVIVSLSSTFQNQKVAIQNSIDALKDLNVRGLVTLGLAMEGEKFESSENVIVLKSAPHSQVFPEADLVITHAGHGTLMRALYHGLPLICLPMGRDQDDNAVKIVYHGCGLKLSRNANAQKIRKAISQVLGDQKFKEKAKSFQRKILSDESLNRAIIDLENLISTRNPVSAS